MRPKPSEAIVAGSGTALVEDVRLTWLIAKSGVVPFVAADSPKTTFEMSAIPSSTPMKIAELSALEVESPSSV